MVKMDSPTCTANNRPEVPFVPFLIGLTAWAVVKYMLEFAVRFLNPELFEDLKLDIRKRYDLYFGVWLGTMYKVISMIACGTALLTTTASADIPGLVRPFTVAEQWCWGCRAVIYIQELPTIASIPELIIHHLLSIAAMIGIINVNMPRRPLYLMWATLLSEFFANSRRLFKFHNRLSPRLTWWFGLAMAVTVLGIRVPGAIVALLWSIRGGFNNIGVFVYVFAIVIYLLYMIKMSLWELDRLKLLIVDTSSRPAYIVVADKWKIDLLGIATGFGLVCAELSALMVHEVNQDHQASPYELQSLAWAALQAVAAGLLGAYLSAPVLRLIVKQRGQGVKPPRLSLRGGFLFAALTLLLSPTVPEDVDKTGFLACMALGFPLLDAFHQVGCYFAGGGSYPAVPSPPRQSPPSPPRSRKGSKDTGPCSPRIAPETPTETILSLPLIASLLSAALYVAVLSLHLAGMVELYRAVGFVLVVEANIHYQMAMHRQDIEYKMSWIKALLLVQAAASIFYVQYTAAPTKTAMAGGALFLGGSYLVVLWAMAVLARPVVRRSAAVKTAAGPPGPGSGRPRRRGGHAGKIASVAATLLLILVLGIAAWFDALPTEITDADIELVENTVATGSQSALWHAAWSWQFAVSTVGVGLLPVVAVQMAGN